MLPKSSISSVLPNRYYTGFLSNPSACCFVEIEKENSFKQYLIVGTLKGSVEIVAVEKGAVPEVKYESKTESQVNSIILVSKHPHICIAVQFRGDEIIWFNVTYELDNISLIKVKSFSLSHYGFCHSVLDRNEKRMFIPGKEDEYESISILYENGGEKSISFGAEFLFASFQKQHPDSELTSDDCFKGSILSFSQIHESAAHNDYDRLLIGFEDATLMIYDIRTKEVINLFKAPEKYSQMLSFAVTKDSENQRWRIAVSVCTRIFEVVYENEGFELTKRIKKTGFAGVNCSHVCFNSSGNILLCGYSSGRIEFYSVPDYNIIKVMNFHESAILCMNVLIECNDEEKNETLFIGDGDGQLSQMDMKKLDNV